MIMRIKVQNPASGDKFILLLSSSQTSTSIGPVSSIQHRSHVFLLGLGWCFDCQRKPHSCFLIPGTTKALQASSGHSDVHWENMPESQHLQGDLFPLFGN